MRCSTTGRSSRRRQNVGIGAPPMAPPPPPLGGLDTAFGIGGARCGSAPGCSPRPRSRCRRMARRWPSVRPTAWRARFRPYAVQHTDGSIDTTFGPPGGPAGGVPGSVFTDFGGGKDLPVGIRIQPDGRILVAGTIVRPGRRHRGELRPRPLHRRPASRNFSFGMNGRVITDFGRRSDADAPRRGQPPPPDLHHDEAHDLVMLPTAASWSTARPDAGGNGTDFALARYTADGQLDLTFGRRHRQGTDGHERRRRRRGQRDRALDPKKGQIVVAGSAPLNTARPSSPWPAITPDGALDAGFGSAAKVLTAVRGPDDEAFGVAINRQGTDHRRPAPASRTPAATESSDLRRRPLHAQGRARPHLWHERDRHDHPGQAGGCEPDRRRRGRKHHHRRRNGRIARVRRHEPCGRRADPVQLVRLRRTRRSAPAARRS